MDLNIVRMREDLERRKQLLSTLSGRDLWAEAHRFIEAEIDYRGTLAEFIHYHRNDTIPSHYAEELATLPYYATAGLYKLPYTVN